MSCASSRSNVKGPPLHVVWVKTELLHPIDKGGKIRTYHMLRGLRQEHEVTYVTLDDGTGAPDAVERAAEYCHHLVRIPFRQSPKGSARFYWELLANLVSPLPYAVAKYRSAAMRDRLGQVLRERRVDVVVCDFLFPSINVVDDGARPHVLFQHNVEAAIWARHASVGGPLLRRLYMREQWRRMRTFEGAECRRFDHVVAVSSDDRETFAREYGVRSVSDVATGVDTEYFYPSGTVTREPGHIVFTGSMDWMPNDDAVVYFVKEILPLVRRRIPHASLTVVGRNPTARVRELASTVPGVQVTGSVPDVRPYLERGSAFAVPIRIGGGTRLKIFEAMAMELPVVSTTIGAEGLPLRNDHEVLLRDDPASFAAALIDVLTDASRSAQLANAAAARVRAEFGWSHVAAQFSGICQSVCADWITHSRSSAA